jgi:membrane protease YdiL (CAAX protease family)
MSGRAALIVLLGWFLTHLASGPAIGFAVAVLPFLKPFALPLVYAFHAVLGVGYLCLAEGIDLRTLWARVAPGGTGRALLAGVGFFALAFAMVVAVASLLSPILHGSEAPQRDLMDLLSRLRGPLTVTLLFLTVAVLAPFFEELLFRGFMLPWLGERLEARFGKGAGWTAAVAITGLTFAAMHMQPMGLPTLGTLGVVLGLAFLRTGNLYTAILVHGLWNGGIFILLRLVG